MSIRHRMFGPSREAVWRKLSDEIGARYVDGGFWKGDKVVVEHGEWSLTLDTYAVSTGKVTVVYTRLRAPFVNPLGFRFTIYRRGVLTGVAKFFGLRDVEIGDPAFDHTFVIKATDESLVRALLASDRLRELIAAQKGDIRFSVLDDEGWFGGRYPNGVDLLHFQVTGVVRELDRLRRFYDLVAETLDQLYRLGAAGAEPPGVDVR